jgi:hypothetical protein
VPGCTAATVTVSSPVTVTVVNADGTPDAGQEVVLQNADGTYLGNVTTDAQGHAVFSPNVGKLGPTFVDDALGMAVAGSSLASLSS